MVLIWIGVIVGVLVALVLIVKLIKTSPLAAVSFDSYCKKCGSKTNGLKCPRCDKKPSFGV